MASMQQQLVQRTFGQAALSADATAELSGNRPLALAPRLRALSGGGMAEQAGKPGQRIGIAVSKPNGMGAALPPVHDLGRRCAGCGVLDERFTPEVEVAAQEACASVAAAMEEAAA